MRVEKLIKMANQVGDFYGAFPDKEEVKREIAGHLNRFWNLNMRQSIANHVAEKQGLGLHAHVIQAIQQYLKVD
ncbi:MAG: formate dehydrogenase subunit delta [Methylophilaceae bacterium]